MGEDLVSFERHLVLRDWSVAAAVVTLIKYVLAGIGITFLIAIMVGSIGGPELIALGACVGFLLSLWAVARRQRRRPTPSS